MRPPSPLRPLAIAACTLAAVLPASSQTHKVQKPESVTRAVGVYEWTGDLLHPSAGRLIPVTLFINGDLQDASIFQPQPIPFALLPGNEYILQQAGLARAVLDLRSASKEPDADTGNVDGWWAFGTVTSHATPTAAKLRPSRTLSSISSSKGDIPPAPVTTPNDDNNRTENSPDPDRPTLRRRSSTGASKQPTAASQPDPSATPPDDPDRPSLKRRPANSASTTSDEASAGSDTQQRSAAAIAGDPDRPTLHRGVPTNGGPTEDTETRNLAKLAGLPKDLHQLIAVSDAANRPEHDFTRPWTDDTERRLITSELESVARAQLATWNPNAPLGVTRSGALVGQTSAEGNPTSPTAGPAFTPAQGNAPTTVSKTTPTTPAARRRAALARTAAARKAASQKAALANLSLDDEDLRAFSLSYGAQPTFVFTAHTASPAVTPAATHPTPGKSAYALGTSNSSTATTSALTPSVAPAPGSTAAGAIRYITLVAQQDNFGHLQIALASITDSAHLDRTPWMRLVGPVDVEASNRASLLFELREQGNRQFSMYRVLSGHADALFTTGTTQ